MQLFILNPETSIPLVIPIGTPLHSPFTFWKKKRSSESSQINSHCHSAQFILPSHEHSFTPPKNSAIIFKSIKLFNKNYIYIYLMKIFPESAPKIASKLNRIANFRNIYYPLMNIPSARLKNSTIFKRSLNSSQEEFQKLLTNQIALPISKMQIHPR